MYIRKSEIQGLVMIGNELRENIQLRDGSRAPPYKVESCVELSDRIFSRMMFKDGETVIAHLEDKTQGRLDRINNPLTIEAKVFYKQQDFNVVLTIGSEYEPGNWRKGLKYLQSIWNEDCGLYEFYIEKRIDKAIISSIKEIPIHS